MALTRLLPRPNVRGMAGRNGAGVPQVIALANQKGGVAKTTTTLNLAVAFREKGMKVLVVDLDPQGNLTMSQGLNPDTIEKSMLDVLVHRIPIEDIIAEREVDVAVASIDLAGAEPTLAMVRENLNPIVEIVGILPTMYDKRTLHSREAVEILRENFGELVFNTKIRKTVRFAEAPVKGASVLLYDSEGEAAKLYRDLAKEVLNGAKTRQH